MLIQHREKQPSIDPTAYVAPTAVLVGDVRIGPRARVMYGAILDAEGSRIELGECTIIAEQAVIRATAAGDHDQPVSIADHVFIGPHATLLGCRIARCAYIATGATILQGATIEAGGSIAVGALVHANAVVPSEFFVPPHTVATGNPLVLTDASDPAGLAAAIKNSRFAAAAFGINAAWEDRLSRYQAATEVRSAEFAAHRNDVILADGDDLPNDAS